MELEGFDVLIQYLNGSKKINYGKPPSFSEKFDKNKSKNRKSENVRKRDLLLTLMREKRPDKILKLIQVCMCFSVPRFWAPDSSLVNYLAKAINKKITSNFIEFSRVCFRGFKNQFISSPLVPNVNCNEIGIFKSAK